MPKRILFVCMGNICRSPAAEGVFRHMVAQRGLLDDILIDSAGTIGYHSGELPDHRMRRTARERGYDLVSRARQIRAEDLKIYDLILVADYENLAALQQMDADGAHREKIKLLAEYCTKHDHEEVPDPYYGEDDGFELVLDLLEDACANLLNELADEN